MTWCDLMYEFVYIYSIYSCITVDSGNRVNERNSWSESIFSQDGAGSDVLNTPMSEPPSDHTSNLFSSLDLHSTGSPDQDGSVCGESHSTNAFPIQSPSEPLQSQETCQDPVSRTAETLPPCPTSLSLKDMECQVCSENVFAENNQTAATPDVDMLLECTFSYMQASDEQDIMKEYVKQGKDSLEDSEQQFKNSLHGDFNLDLSYDPIRPLGYSPEPEPTPSSDEEDIYAHGMPSSASLGDGLNALSLQSSSAKQKEDEEMQLLKADQVVELTI